MATILCIETATTNCSVALSVNGKTVAVIEDNNNQYSHAERLHVFIDEILKKSAIHPTQLDAVAISKGPGSYTGLRIGVSAAKGLSYALHIPLISVATLQALAYKVKDVNGVIVSMLDARRMEVYAAIFNANYQEIRETKAEILTPELYNYYLENNTVYFIGNAVTKAKQIISHQNAVFIENELPSAKQMGSIAFQKFKQKYFEDVAYFEPFYLKDFVAIKPKK